MSSGVSEPVAPTESNPQDGPLLLVQDRAAEPVTTPAEDSEQAVETRSVDDLSPETDFSEITRRYNFLEQRKKMQEMLDELQRDEAKARHRIHMERIRETARIEREEATRLAEASIAKNAVAKNKPERTWETKFLKRFYGIDPKTDDHYGFLPKPILQVVMARGSLRASFEKIQQQLEPFFLRFEAAEKHLVELNQIIPEQMLREAMAKDASLAADGKFTELVSASSHPNPDEIHRMLDFRRLLLREAQKLAAESCKPLIFEIGERLQASARLLASELDETERSTAEKFGVNYVPSEQLKACIRGGLYYAEQVRKTFMPAARTNPRHYIHANLLGN